MAERKVLTKKFANEIINSDARSLAKGELKIRPEGGEKQVAVSSRQRKAF